MMEPLPVTMQHTLVHNDDDKELGIKSSKSSSSPWSAKRSSAFAPSKGSNNPLSNALPAFRSCSALPEYFWRIMDYRQMDLEATYYQMVTLCISPSKVYKSAFYRKQTKNRWARDDPAFAVIQALFLLISSLAWTIAFRKTSSLAFLLLCDFLVEWLLLGLLIATTTWWCANHFLRLATPGSNGGLRAGDTFFVEQTVEWQYAFDIHCNAFFLLFLIVHVLQFLLVPLLLSNSFLSLLLANTIYAVACGSYFYITFLGYMALPFLHNTERFLYPIVGVGGMYLSTLVLKLLFGANFNFAAMSAAYYYGTISSTAIVVSSMCRFRKQLSIRGGCIMSRRRGTANMFTGETPEQASEKHNLKLDYAAMLQEQARPHIREQSNKKEQAKLKKQEEQRREREDMDRVRGNNNSHVGSPERQPLQIPQTKQLPPLLQQQSIQQQHNHQPQQPQAYSPLKPAVATISAPSPLQPSTTFGETPEHHTFYNQPQPPLTFSLPSWRPIATTTTSAIMHEVDAIQRLRHELEDARKQRMVATKQAYQKPNFMLPTTKARLHSTTYLENPCDPLLLVQGRDNRRQRPHSRPTTPGEVELGGPSNQLESSSSFVAVLGGSSKHKPAIGLSCLSVEDRPLEVESCFLPVTLGHPYAHQSHHSTMGFPSPRGGAPTLGGGVPSSSHCSGLEDSIDDIDAILQAFLTKPK
ncbi:Aste57867_21746 [Aphanomyces stellatus]|uniref:Aste57867_21746 protein n=1 Tax=Aphanomyces stellatus TaxID=120398 RepID=A0A485LN66_9STRA|nr:hypothetical protein As57867_021677 [Aphanomyces stellatus]VFT98415.1 Aste57867_21746 [Aphanomyces stellatus]